MEAQLQRYFKSQAGEIDFRSVQVVIELTAEGATVPFLARYRKDKTGNLDEVQIRKVIEVHETFQEIVKRKVFLLKEIGEQGNLSADIQKRIEVSWDLGELEEIYRPFKKKKKTKATLARDAGLEPLALWIWDVGHQLLSDDTALEVKAKNFLNIPAGVISYEMALKGAQDIVVEKIVNEPGLREKVRENYFSHGLVVSKRTKNFKPHSKFEMYADFQEPVKSLLDSRHSHRYLAMRRGWQEEELLVEIQFEEDSMLASFEIYATSTPSTTAGLFLKDSARQALKVYVIPSVSNEVHKALKDKADLDSIQVFAENVRKILLASPYGPRVVLGLDPGLKTGCKLALVDKSGQYISHTVLDILGSEAFSKAKTLFSEVLKQIKIEAIAVGNGTAGRQAESFVRKVLKDIGQEIPVVMVSEAGASVYSASELAREEFPQLDLTVKGAISIARRLQDPLSELVKVDPKSIGVGQYQHDVNQNLLKKSLDHVVESCVNMVGVDLNTASPALLAQISGIGPALAQNIVEFRKAQLFKDRMELLKVPKFSSKAFEQSAGFLRIPQAKSFLDTTGIHPERYQAVKDMTQELGIPVNELAGEGAKKLLPLKEKYAPIIGEFTFLDIINELTKPGRDPRDPFKVFQFRDDIFEVKDLKEGMICSGIVTNVTNFGAFVDIGVHQDGLVHISELAHQFVDDPRKVVSPGDQVKVKVRAVDLDKKQISLSMKLDAAPQVNQNRNDRKIVFKEPRAAQPQQRPVGGSNNNRNGQAPRGARPKLQSQTAGMPVGMPAPKPVVEKPKTSERFKKPEKPKILPKNIKPEFVSQKKFEKKKDSRGGKDFAQPIYPNSPPSSSANAAGANRPGPAAAKTTFNNNPFAALQLNIKKDS